MNSPRGHSPRRYFVDGSGRRVLIGLTIEETSEFEILDNLPALDEPGGHVARDENGAPTTTREKRWRELYCKHISPGWSGRSELRPTAVELQDLLNIIERPYALFAVILV